MKVIIKTVLLNLVVWQMLFLVHLKLQLLLIMSLAHSISIPTFGRNIMCLNVSSFWEARNYLNLVPCSFWLFGMDSISCILSLFFWNSSMFSANWFFESVFYLWCYPIPIKTKSISICGRLLLGLLVS